MSNIQKGWIAPDEWVRIFTAAILEVAEDLKIDVKGELNNKENCLFTRVTRREVGMNVALMTISLLKADIKKKVSKM